MYKPYPGTAQMPSAERPRPPAPVRHAMMVMYAGAAVSLVRIIVVLLTRASLKAGIKLAAAHGAVPLTTGQVNAAVASAIALSVAAGVISVALWLVVARASGQARKWAQVSGSVLFALDTLALVAGPLGLAVVGAAPAAAKLCTALVWLAGLAAVVLLWQAASRSFFNRQQP